MGGAQFRGGGLYVEARGEGVRGASGLWEAWGEGGGGRSRGGGGGRSRGGGGGGGLGVKHFSRGERLQHTAALTTVGAVRGSA